MADIVARLLRECNLERHKGADFPTIWTTILKGHPYVAGLPEQGKDAAGPLLLIPLITGQQLIFDGSAFSLT